MGFKLREQINPIPVEIREGTLTSIVGNYEKRIEIPALKGFDFPMQCNFFKGSNIMAYLVNYDTSICCVLRFDGTGTLYRGLSRTLIKGFTFDFNLSRMRGFPGGAYVYGSIKNKEFEMFSLYGLNEKMYILTCDSPMLVAINMDENKQYMLDSVYNNNEMYPLIKSVDGELCAFDMHDNLLYKINGTVYKGDGFTILQ